MDGTIIKPYGDNYNDGKIQLSFTLPMKASGKAKEVARLLAKKMGLDDINVVEMKDLGQEFSFFVVYARTTTGIDISEVVVEELLTTRMSFDDINTTIKARLGRQITVVGACTGFDAHTVGLDAIMNMKGFAGEPGLERYSGFLTFNLGSQVSNVELIKKAAEVNADAILVSQVVTQKGIHVINLTELVELLEAEGLRQRFVLIVGGPRISHELAMELGYDAGFGTGTLPIDVASYLVEKLTKI